MKAVENVIQVYYQQLTTLQVHTSWNKDRNYPLGTLPSVRVQKLQNTKENNLILCEAPVDSLIAGISSRFCSQREDLETASTVGIPPEVRVVLVQKGWSELQADRGRNDNIR